MDVSRASLRCSGPRRLSPNLIGSALSLVIQSFCNSKTFRYILRASSMDVISHATQSA